MVFLDQFLPHESIEQVVFKICNGRHSLPSPDASKLERPLDQGPLGLACEYPGCEKVNLGLAGQLRARAPRIFNLPFINYIPNLPQCILQTR